jgi:hypothetical protein
MKKGLILCFLLTAGFIGISEFANAQHFYVSVQPVAPVIVRPVAPSPHHIWVEDEWVWRGGAYVRVPGYWALPPHHYTIWIPGHWVHEEGHGHYWVPGHWK